MVCVLCMSVLLAGCGSQDRTQITMHEPRFVKTEYGQDIFRLSWTKAHQNVESYELAFWCDVEERGCRDTKTVSKKNSSVEIHLLNGVYTDTVTYRMKVRPVYNSAKKEYGTWSNIWMVDYVNGEYTISECADDFDSGTGKKPAEKQQTASAQSTNTENRAEQVIPLEHTYPEALVTYLARERGIESVDLTETVKLAVTGRTCLEGFPTQTITDGKTIAEFLDAVSACMVEADYDNIFSTATSYSFSLYDENDACLGSFTLQDGRIPAGEKRYLLTGANALLVEGIMKVSDWEDYFSKEQERRDAYWETFRETYPDNIFHRAGYSQNAFWEDREQITVTGIEIYVDYVDGMKFYTEDDNEIAAIMEGLSDIKVTKKQEEQDAGHMWHLIVYYSSPEEENGIYFSFRGKTLQSQDDYFSLEGMDEFFRRIDHDCFRYMEKYIEQRRLNPHY